MKAIAYDKYGPFDVLALRDIDKPAAKDGEVLVRVRAAGLQIGDVFAVRGAPYAMRMYTGLLKPKWGVPGFDLAGQVEAVGSGAKQFQPGDEVFGSSQAACAEYAVAREDQLVLKPANLTFEEAAAIPTFGARGPARSSRRGKVQPGQKVLINGASGGVGHFAVQIAKALGAEVTGVCSTKNVDMVRSHRRRSRHRLHAGGLHERRKALRRHPRQRREPLAIGRRDARSSPPGRSSSTAAPARPASRCWSAWPSRSSCHRSRAKTCAATSSKPNHEDLVFAEGARRVRQAQAGHRQDLPAERDRRGPRLYRRRPRCGESRRHHRTLTAYS